MKKLFWLLVLIVLPCAVSAQTTTCKNIDSSFGPITCPNNASCGSYHTYRTSDCNIELLGCVVLIPITVCCGAYNNYRIGDQCFFTKMRDPHFRSRIRELAKKNEILVPACSGGYVPVRFALRKYEGSEDGGL